MLLPPDEFDRPTSAPSWLRELTQACYLWARRHPIPAILALAVASNCFGSIFSIMYNGYLIVHGHVPEEYQWVFWQLGLNTYNPIIYAICVGLGLHVLKPIRRAHPRLLAGEEVPADELRRCQRRLIHFPLHVIWINSLGWIGGGIFFPALVCSLAPVDNLVAVWTQFVVSFAVSALVTTAQTFFLLEEFLILVLYPLFFRTARPADIPAHKIPFYVRLLLLWVAVGFMPLLAMVVVAANVPDATLRGLLFLIFVVGGISGWFISFLVGSSLLRWLKAHAAATDRVARQIFHLPVREQRPDEWGVLTARFNDMSSALGDAQRMRETFGQIVHPDVRDAVLDRFEGLGGELRTITVVFADIRGFTRRCEGQSPSNVVDLLNRFLSLAVAAIEDRCGVVNKFLGDGLMAIFGAPYPQQDQADRALDAAITMHERLGKLNQELVSEGQAPLEIGVGIHTGAAIVGCVGAVMDRGDGRTTMRREFTAIGDTVNLSQRLEQLTKILGGPILISEHTRQQLTSCIPLQPLGAQKVKGLEVEVDVHQVLMDRLKTG